MLRPLGDPGDPHLVDPVLGDQLAGCLENTIGCVGRHRPNLVESRDATRRWLMGYEF